MVRLHRLRGYDEATGLVYEETQVPVTSMVSACECPYDMRQTRDLSYENTQGLRNAMAEDKDLGTIVITMRAPLRFTIQQ